MKTDIKETESAYELDIDLPGYKKEDVQAELKDGYLTISAKTNTTKEEKDENGKYLRKERYSGSCSRSFYVGEDITEEDIKAKFEDGTLKLSIPKKEAKPVEKTEAFDVTPDEEVYPKKKTTSRKKKAESSDEDESKPKPKRQRKTKAKTEEVSE